MNLPLCVLLCNFLVLSTFTVVTGENVNTNQKASKKLDIYIDDEDLDGSGNGEDKYDLESSGSGFGPDDEDARSGVFPVSKNDHKNTQLTVSPKTDNEEPTLPMPTPKTQSPPPPPPAQPESPAIDTFTKSTTSEPTVRKLPMPEEKLPIDTFANNGDKTQVEDTSRNENSVYITNNHDRDRTTSFFAQPGILAAVIGGAVVGLLCAILVVMFIVYRMRKKDEGSYALEEMKRCPATNPYMKPNHREFFA